MTRSFALPEVLPSLLPGSIDFATVRVEADVTLTAPGRARCGSSGWPPELTVCVVSLASATRRMLIEGGGG